MNGWIWVSWDWVNGCVDVYMYMCVNETKVIIDRKTYVQHSGLGSFRIVLSSDQQSEILWPIASSSRRGIPLESPTRRNLIRNRIQTLKSLP